MEIQIVKGFHIVRISLQTKPNFKKTYKFIGLRFHRKHLMAGTVMNGTNMEHAT